MKVLKPQNRIQNNRKVDPLNILTPIRSDRYVFPLATHTYGFSHFFHGNSSSTALNESPTVFYLRVDMIVNSGNSQHNARKCKCRYIFMFSLMSHRGVHIQHSQDRGPLHRSCIYANENWTLKIWVCIFTLRASLVLYRFKECLV